VQKIQACPDFAIMRLSVLKFKFPEYGHCMELAARGMADLN